MTERIWCIKKCRLFEQLSPTDLELLEARARVRVFPGNSSIYFPGDSAESVYVLAEGRIRLYSITPDGKQAILAIIEPGELFGELAILGSEEREEHAQAVGTSKVVSLPRDALETMLLRNPDVSLGITKFVGFRRKRLERRLRNLLFRSNRERLVGLLCELLELYGRQLAEGFLIDIKLSHQEIAGLIGITRESVTLTLGELQLERLITVGRQRIVVLRPDQLALAAGEKTCQSRHTISPAPQVAPSW
ncbi:MAG: Crp/Fnr family transcriptional regulator [Planctomyces sp.]|nr:Crp/Fnr family transcriptional regulator [Planctomyces sp.]